MTRSPFVLALAGALAASAPTGGSRAGTRSPDPAEVARWQREASAVTITRDDWGIAHVHGKTDADAVFGMEYAQAEDDFNRVETNYLNAMGRLAEAEGESAVYQDLRMKLFINPDTLRTLYARSPGWLKALMNAFADGLNYYLYRHPDVHPRVITRFEPWMALSFTEGSIGGDVERVNLGQLRAFYGGDSAQASPAGTGTEADGEPRGSNGIAISPANSVDHHALLLINPHTSFYFRSELQMASDHGLDAYGAVTWGQFFIYQGFNSHAGWMHTSSGVDAVDEFLETVTDRGGRYFYRHGSEERPLVSTVITVPYRDGDRMDQKKFTVYYTMHGPVIGQAGGKWVTISLMNSPVKALTQSYTRTRATDYRSFRKTLELHANSSNNTIFADANGNIAYFHGNYIPRRDTAFDWTRTVDGSNPATDYHGLLSVDESPHLLNPASGWIYNSNNWPWSAAGPSSPRREAFPAYVETGRAESPRGLHAIRVLSNRKDFTLDGLLAAAFDTYLPYFEARIPPLIKAWDDLPASDPLRARVADQIAMLRTWDLRWSASSIPTTLAIYWSQQRPPGAGRGGRGRGSAATVDGRQMLEALAAASDTLRNDFGTWKTPWGDINRFQRLNDDIVQVFNDAAPSIPVPFPSATFGSLASFGARRYPNTRKWYGTSGNSFVAVVEFGPRVRARAVTAGGESGHPDSRHFDDEAQRYASGNLRPVYYYPDELKGHVERTYHPGE